MRSVHINAKALFWGGLFFCLYYYHLCSLQVQVGFQWQVVAVRGRGMVSVRPLRADVGGNALPPKYWAWHMLRLLPLRRPLPLLLCWLRQQAQSFVRVREREREREQAGRDGHAPRDLKPPVSSSLTSQGARNKNQPPSNEFFTSRRARATISWDCHNSSVHTHTHTQIRWYWTFISNCQEFNGY